MAVVVEAFDVVARIDVVPGGEANFRGAVPNRTFCSDGRLLRASFMTESDRSRFVASLGVSTTSGVALLEPGMADEASPHWVVVGSYAGVQAAWLRGEDPEPLVVPLSWTSSELEFRDNGAREQLEYLGREGGVDVYVDKRTGQRSYTGRTGPALDEAQTARFATLREEASELVGPFADGQPRDLGFFQKRRLKSGIRKLCEALTILPDDWSTHWTLGMSWRALREHDQALEHFRRAYAQNAFHPDVGREYAGQCMIAGRGPEAVDVSRAIHARFPDDAGLESNLGLALLIAGQLDEAERVAASAHRRDPEDRITEALLGFIRKVRAGSAERPTRMPGW